MDFTIGFPRTSRQHDSIMVVVDKLTKATHFIPMTCTHSSSEVAHVFIRDILRLHGVAKKIMSRQRC